MNSEGIKEIINTLFEGLISLVVVVGAGYIAVSHPDSIALIGLASGAGMAVITFWFGQRAQAKALNGNITALSTIASQMGNTREQAASTAANTALQAVAVAKEH